ncbi:chemotaxis regulatory protein ChePep [Helicobacter pylori]|jgi:AAA ATPase containing von Willebrand factor type A (vWA) domain|uniref:Chemotaxis regulatory protein ChePep n=2 Tax=Helicobacter pylori TaxID=210 RepID=CHPEP_HELPY|nr:chemotaxis regulatory protein ChePep [Helicobacter pylori]O25089.1 RecName: Full=Chemotaxis regulatory protein ChePep [Helicobacter pylori 26695]AAD07390.1 poly E-rich protein [Helicobacter pylori 26695]AFV41547.1 poly E-rich protein [Helicobacter pylori 26695]AFV43141.1 poly E-rich protein [Helicobacter pylori Rif1]AFV44734.1 poly E-rich protein [Helicobacter pylori Rif2]AJF08625.1 poly E-rich protein [Helicobacter pylori 26695-1]
MKMILFNQNPMITKLLESVSKKLELPIENFNHYQELSARLKENQEWLLIADDECLEKLDQVDWLELKETISQNKNSVCMYKKGNEAQPFLEGFEVKIKKPFLPTEMLKVLQKKLGSNASELEPSQNLDPTQEVLETNWDELENLGDLEALVQEEPNNEEQLLPTLNDQEEKEEVKEEEKEEVKEEEKEEVKEEEKEEVKETPQEEKKPKDDETQEGETLKDKEVSKELEAPQELEIPKEETQEQDPIKEETQENKEEKQEKTQDSPSAQELEAMQELVKEIQENSNGQENKEKTQESAEIPQDKEIQEVVTEKTQAQELEVPKEKTQESAEALQETQAHELEKQEIAETPQDVEIPQSQDKEVQELEIPKEETQENTETPQDVETPQEKETQEDHYESIEDIPEPVMAKAMGEELPFLNEAVAKIPNNENDTETPKESVTETSKNENNTETPQEKEESDKTSSPLELRLNLQDLLKSLNQESLKSLLENKTLSIKITLEDKKPNA